MPRAHRLLPAAVLLASGALAACAPSLLEAGSRSFPSEQSRWACDDGSDVLLTASTEGSLVRFESGASSRLLAPAPGSTGRRWADESVSFWARGTQDALLATAGAVTSCRGLS